MPANEQSHAVASSRTWTATIGFGIVLVMSIGMIRKELKIYNSQFLNSMVETIDGHSITPTSHVSWSPLGSGTQNTSSLTMKAIAPSAFKKFDKELGWVWEKGRTIPSAEAKPLQKQEATPTVKTELTEKKDAISPDVKTLNETLVEEISDFKRYDKVAIVTKIHGPHQWTLVDQSLCLLHFAYNHKVLYDIVIFSASEVPKENIEAIEEKITPAKIKVVIDNIGLQEEIAALPKATYDLFLKRCGVTDPVNLTWWSECKEPNLRGRTHRLAYNWQAEFRSVRIWDHPALAEYKYMLWLDSDGFPSKEWRNDPVEYFVEKKGVIMFDHFPQGNTAKHNHQIVQSFNGSTVCDLHLDKEKGHLVRKLANKEQLDAFYSKNTTVDVPCKDFHVHMIHGFMHITDLDFFRQPKILNGLKTLLGDCFLCRSPDDQLAVTIAPAIFAPEKAWEMRSHGFDLKVYHNMAIDGQEKANPRGFVKYWNEVAKEDFPTANQVCKVTARDR